MGEMLEGTTGQRWGGTGWLAPRGHHNIPSLALTSCPACGARSGMSHRGRSVVGRASARPPPCPSCRLSGCGCCLFTSQKGREPAAECHFGPGRGERGVKAATERGQATAVLRAALCFLPGHIRVVYLSATCQARPEVHGHLLRKPIYPKAPRDVGGILSRSLCLVGLSVLPLSVAAGWREKLQETDLVIVFYLLTALPSAAARLPRCRQGLASRFPLAPSCWRSASPGDASVPCSDWWPGR